MKALFCILLIATAACSCNHISQHLDALEKAPDSSKQQVADAEENMFHAIEMNDNQFWNTVSDSYITINADGVMANKATTIADSARRKMFVGISHKLFDHTVRVFDNVGICNGRAQFAMQGKTVAEVYYTAIFRKQNNNWLYEGWQGTLTKNNPPPPGY